MKLAIIKFFILFLFVGCPASKDYLVFVDGEPAIKGKIDPRQNIEIGSCLSVVLEKLGVQQWKIKDYLHEISREYTGSVHYSLTNEDSRRVFILIFSEGKLLRISEESNVTFGNERISIGSGYSGPTPIDKREASFEH